MEFIKHPSKANEKGLNHTLLMILRPTMSWFYTAPINEVQIALLEAKPLKISDFLEDQKKKAKTLNGGKMPKLR